MDDILSTLTKEFASHEDSITHQKYSVDTWVHYLNALEDKNPPARIWVGKRALRVLPRSYKLWKAQWEFETKHGDALQCFQHAVTLMAKYPRFWIDFYEWLEQHPGVLSLTELRRTINRGLQALPITQHEKIWPCLLKLVQNTEWNLPVETQQRILERYTHFDPSYRPQLAEFLQHNQKYGPAALVYVELLQDDPENDTYWTTLSELCTQHSLELQDYVDWQHILKSATQHSKLQGLLWAQLSDAWIRRGSFDVARSVLEEGLQQVNTVRDFTIVYDTYLQLEEGLLEAAANAVDTEDSEDVPEEDDWDIILDKKGAVPSTADLELAMARAEHLTSRRPILLNAVLLRQNPHNVEEWVNRGNLFMDQPRKAAEVLETALRTVDPRQAAGSSPSAIVLKLLEIYEESDVAQARELMVRICRQHEYAFIKPECLATCWSAWIELELRHEKWDDALALAREAVAPKSISKKLNLTKSLKLWDLLLDLEESLGTVQSAKDAYNRAIDVKAATVQHILNFASFLKEHNYFEESFAAFEKGVDIFSFPHPGAKLLWKEYLNNFLERYKGTKVERVRDLFQRCLEHCPAEECADFYILNADFEEKYGLSKRALSVYQDMCGRVPEEEKLVAYRLFIAKTKKYLGVVATRDVYQSAVEILKEADSAQLCLDFAEVETSLQEFDRARGIYAYGAQMADPRRLPEFWKQWNEFEVAHGTEDTFREMLRTKRSVEMAFSTIVYSGVDNTQAKVLSNEEAMKKFAEEGGVDPQNQTAVSGFVSSSKRKEPESSIEEIEERTAKMRRMEHDEEDLEDEAEIDLDDIDAEIEAAAAEGEEVQGDEKETEVSTKAVPKAVFGGLAKD